MDVKYINPFISSLNNTLETMLSVSPGRNQPFLKSNNKASGDVSGIIGFASQEVVGSVALTFPEKAALKAYELLMGETLPHINEEVQDMVGELANIVAGGAKEEFNAIGIVYHISIPTVVTGKGHSIGHKGGVPVVVIPFELNGLPFYMEVSMKVKPGLPTVQKLVAENVAG
ncbi:chemotaxis protein CheX [bacterium]|nr:chemotaxis protein CheX [bacterium]